LRWLETRDVQGLVLGRAYEIGARVRQDETTETRTEDAVGPASVGSSRDSRRVVQVVVVLVSGRQATIGLTRTSTRQLAELIARRVQRSTKQGVVTRPE
jgi:hypothetical protein